MDDCQSDVCRCCCAAVITGLVKGLLVASCSHQMGASVRLVRIVRRLANSRHSLICQRHVLPQVAGRK
jgi:hypothetical protein